MRLLVGRFENWSLRWKLTGVSMAVTILVVVVAAMTFFVADYYNFQKTLVNDTLSEAEIMGQNCSAPMMFGDHDFVKRLISAAKLRQDITRVVVLDSFDKNFSSFVRDGAVLSGADPVPMSDGSRFSGGFLTVKKALEVDGKKVGYIFVEKNLSMFYRHELETFAVLAIILVLAFPAALLLSVNLQRFLTEPISDLVAAASKVSDMRDYSVRANSDRNDELGVLARVFNEMLAHIEENEATLKNHAAKLELEVKRRTEELSDGNQRLVSELARRKIIEQELIHAREEAENATKLKDKFVSLVSHDLRSPLSSMKFGLGMLGKDTSLGPQSRKLLDTMVSVTNSLVDLINRLLDVSQFKTGKISLRNKFVDVRRLGDEILDRYSPLAGEKEISLKNEVPEGFRVFADQVFLGECLSNLVSNAVKFCNKGNQVTVFCPPDKPSTFAVRDNGVGMSKKMVSNLFNPSVKSFGVGTAGERGTGLGLNYCNEIMLAHNGTITVESEQGTGSVFYLHLPYVRPVVLVVDDDPIVYLMAKEFLAELETDTLEAGDGLKALDTLENKTVHLVITDIHMPRMNGLELLEKIKNNPEIAHLPIIAATGDIAMKVNGMDVRSHMLQHGCDDFVNKPFSESDLVPRVRRLLYS